jgi:hypothetical protein
MDYFVTATGYYNNSPIDRFFTPSMHRLLNAEGLLAIWWNLVPFTRLQKQ